MFNKRKYLYAACKGYSDTLASVPDEAFSSGMLGVGYSIIPNDNKVLAPISGTIGSIASTKHAYTITTKDGIDVLIHIGIDTVGLEGSGFDCLVIEKQRVNAGDTLAYVNFEKIKEKGFATNIVVLITNPENIESIEYDLGNECKESDALISFKIKKE